MIKHINHQNFLTTPFVAVKSWELGDFDNDELILVEPSGSEVYVANDYIDYYTGNPLLNRSCNILLEQQELDLLYYQEGETGSGDFDPNSDPKNIDGTYKRLVHTQIKNAFYNRYNNPAQILGVEYIDFPLSKTKRYISDYIRIFTIPRDIFGEKIVPHSVQLYDTNLDDNVVIVDDGFQNIIAGYNLFSRVQEVRTYIPPTGSNIVINSPRSGSFYCGTYDVVNVSILDSGSLGITFLSGSITEYLAPISASESSSIGVIFLSGSITEYLAPVSASESSSIGVTFLSGSIDQLRDYNSGSISVAFITGSIETSWSYDYDSMRVSYLFGSIEEFLNNQYNSLNVSFNTGSIWNGVTSTSGSATTSSIVVGFNTGSIWNGVLSTSGSATTSSIVVGFYSGAYVLQAIIVSGSNNYGSMSVAFYSGYIT
jgi:hypothetical protein